MLPLEGITVVAVEQAVAAPFATRQLADLGARIIKIERPGTGDFARGYDAMVNGMSSHFVWLNRSKQSLTLDLKRAEFEGEFGKSSLRAVLFALYELQREVDIDEAIGHLRDLVPGYLSRREDLMALASAIASKREVKAPTEAQAARILFSRIKNERLG